MTIEHAEFVKRNLFARIDRPAGLNLVRKDWRAPIRQYVQAMPRAFIEMELGAFSVRYHPNATNPELRTMLLDAIFKDESLLVSFAKAHPIAPDVVKASEYWSVSEYMATKLRTLGEAVEDVGDLHVWGRCATDLPIEQDPAIQLIRRQAIKG